MTAQGEGSQRAGSALLRISGLSVEGRTGSAWRRIIKDVDLDLDGGEVLGLIGESGAGKSTLGLATMGFVYDGCHFSAGSVWLDGLDLVTAPRARRRELRSSRIAYVAQSAAASFNPAHRLIDQCTELPVLRGLMSRRQAERDAIALR
jgi:peptide/nickel transport system ATP-binding protein